MKILSVPLARAMWVIDMDRANPRGRSLLDALNAIAKRYRFAKFPAHLLDYDQRGGLSFLSGTFDRDGRDIRVGLTVFTNGIQGDTLSSTDDSEAFLQDVREWLAGAFDFAIEDELITAKAYQSQLEVQMQGNVASLNPRLGEFAEYLSDKAIGIDGKKHKFAVGGFLIFPNDIGANAAPHPFRFERKYGVPFDDNVYFTQAQVRTGEHVEMLEKLEKLL